jgi:CubicO group peptidase (beta-lactamase class C family)
VKAGLKPDVLGRLDVELQRHVAASNVAGIVALIHKNGQRGYFETFGMADIEAGKPMPKDGIFRLMSMTKPVIAVAALTLYDEGKFSPDEPISKHCPEWASPKVLEDGKPLDVVLKKKVFVPLKMVDTDFWVPPAKASRICQIYTQPQPGVLKPGREASKLTEKPSLFLGGHGLCSTTTD